MNGKEVQSNSGPAALSGGAGQDGETHAERAEHWLNLCNFTNLQQKLQLLKNDPQWAVTYEQLQLDPQLLLKTYRLPDSQLQKNWQTYVELVQRAGDPSTMINEQVPSAELLRLVQGRVEQVLQRLQARLDAFPPVSAAEDSGDKDQAKKQNQRVDLREIVAYGLFNVISAYAVYDQAVDICAAQRRFAAEEQGNYGAELGLCQLMACILYHTRDEVSSFWIAVSLVEYYDMRQFYQRGLPGLTLYGEVLGVLLEKHLPELNQVLLQYEITYLDFFEEWATSHFLNQMPVDLSLQCLSEFLREGWPFFFRLCLSVLKSMQNQILTLAKTNQEKPLRQKLAHQCVSEQILAVLSFQEPRLDYKPEHAAIPDDISAMENFRNLNESANALSGQDAAENFLDLEDEQKQFDNNFAIVDDKPRKRAPAQDRHDDRNKATVKAKVSKIVVNREKCNTRSASECRPGLGQESVEGQRGVGGLFKKFRDMIGLSKEDQKKQAQKMQDLKRIQSLLGNPRQLTASDFVRDSRETWAYLLEIVKYEWIVPEKQEALCAPTGASSSINGQPEQMKPENLDALLAPEYQRDYQVSKDLVQQLLAFKQNVALRKFLDWQKRLQEKERDQMMDKARKEQLEAAQQQAERRESEPPTSGQSAGQEISEGTQGGQRSRKASCSRDRAEAPDRLKPGTPLLSYGAGQSIVQFDALNSSKNGGHGALGNRKASYTGSVFNHPRGSIQSNDAFKPPVESNGRYSGPAASNLGVSLNLDFAASVAGGHIAGPRHMPGISPSLLGAGTGSQVHGIYTGGYPGLFNEADVSMMDEMNKLLMGLGGAGLDQDLRQRGSQRAQKSSTPTPHLPPGNLHVADVKTQKASVSPVPSKVPVTLPAQRNSAGNPGPQTQPPARQSYGGSSSCIKSSRFDREEQDDLIIGGGGIGLLPAKGQARNSLNSHNLSRVSQFAHMENISKIEMKQEEAYDTFGDVSLQKCLQLGQLSFQHRNSERYQASLQQQSMIKNERPQNILNGQEQFKLNLQKIDDRAEAPGDQRRLRAIDEQPAQNECTPNKLMTGQRPAQATASAADGSPFVRSPVSDYSKTGFGNDQFNFKDTSQITTGERNNVHAMDMRERQHEGPGMDEPDEVRPERDKTKERPVDQYVSPQTAAKKTAVAPATPAWKQAPTQSQHKERKTKIDFQRRQLVAYQQQNQPGNDATLMIVPDKAGQSSDSVGLMSPLHKQAAMASRFDQPDPRDQAGLTSPLATKQAMPQSTPGFARPVNSQSQFNAQHNQPATLPTASPSNKIQIHCMPQTKKRNYFDNNFGSFGAGSNAVPSPAGATKPATLHGHNVQLLKQKPLSIKTVTPMKLLMLTNSSPRPGRQNQAEEKEKVAPGEKPPTKRSSQRHTLSKGGAPAEPASRTHAIMQGKRTNNMQRQSAMEDAGRGPPRQARPSESIEQAAERDLTPVIAESRHRGRHLKKFPEILHQASAAKERPQQKREISKIIVEDCNEYEPADGNRQLESIDQVRGHPHDNIDKSKMERSGLGNSANDSKRSLKKSLSISKNLSRSIKNVKLDEISAVLNFQGVRQDNSLNAQAKDERPLSPMFNGAREERGRPGGLQQSAQMSSQDLGSPAEDQAVMRAHDAEHLVGLPSPIRPPDQQSDGAPKQEEMAVPVLASQPPQRAPELEPQQNSVMSAKQQAIKEKMLKIQEMKKQQKNKLGNNSTFGGAGDNQTRVSHADRTNVQNNSSKSLGLGLNASSSLIFGRGGCNSSKNNLNNTNQSQEGKLAFQLNQSKMTNRTNRTNRSKNSAHSSSCSNKLKNIVSNQLAGKQASLNFEHFESPGLEKDKKKALRDAGFGGQGEVEAMAIDIDKQNEPRKSLSAPKSERKSFKRRLASEQQEGETMQNCSVEEQQKLVMLAEVPAQQVLDLDREIEKELKRLTEDNPHQALEELSVPQALVSPEHSGLGMAAQPRGSGNDMNFWFGEQQAAVEARGSGNDPRFRNMLRPQKENNEPANESFQQHQPKVGWADNGAKALAEQAKKQTTDPALTSEVKGRSSSAGAAMDPRQKEKKVKAIQDFINNAKKNKFSEWRKLKQQNQTQSSDQSQGR